jgi:dihydroorotase
LRSQGKHTPFAHNMGGSLMPGRVKMTLVNGQIAYDELN